METEHPNLLAEFIEEVTYFSNKRLATLQGVNLGSSQPNETIENPVVKEAVANTAASVSPPSEDEEPRDPVRFLMKYRYLDGKRVKVETPNGEIEGRVKGLVTPFIRIETNLGYEINVPPKAVRVLVNN